MKVAYFVGFLLFIVSQTILAVEKNQNSWGLTVGGASVHQGAEQLINIQNSLGNTYIFNKTSDHVAMIGFSWLRQGLIKAPFDVGFGVSAYYFAPAEVDGTIYLERNFPNLSFQYEVKNIPLYVASKIVIPNKAGLPSAVIDLGVGANFITTRNYLERSIDGGISIPSQSFSGKSSVKSSAMAGIGIRLNRFIKNVCLEFGYKYFYLNTGDFNPADQILTNLSTKQMNAHVLALTLMI